MLALAILCTWATGPTVLAVERRASELFDDLDAADFDALESSVRSISWCVTNAQRRPLALDPVLVRSGISPRLASILTSRMSPRRSQALFDQHVWPKATEDPAILGLAFHGGYEAASGNRLEWTKYLDWVLDAYESYPDSEAWVLGRFETRRSSPSMPVELATRILENAEAYPAGLVTVAEGLARVRVGRYLTSVGDIATAEGWNA